ncbi:hypothetical protein CLV24_11216 [Pontibacter ummariensis]|uniref:Uncharacterized protein n=1 Tax=Pontibacter ummariensis TaxID=1610492 RepID=A0A239H463_9BACT|nr:hypothetical protein [Pontibacter ummariensis]PRY10889.1 hypothetical protein CLV24_11216 [Pontibacter ummariensis]SNS76199.1 hypothetical protein SAMN06296052_112162 [Pontibacter ummariensis]
MRVNKLTALLLSLAFLGCNKDKDPTPSPKVEVKDITFNFRLDPMPAATEKFELIVSQKDGEVLLDTLLAPRTAHALSLKSADDKFNITTIYSDPATNKYALRTYIQVNPDNWHIDENISYSEWGETERATIHYTNAPYWDGIQFTGKQGGTFGATYSGGSIILKYQRLLPTDLTYLLLPESGKYIFAEITSPETHVDFSHASTAVKRRYTKPAGATDFISILFGYTKAGDYRKTMTLTLSGPGSDYDLQFPTTMIEEFETRLLYTDAEGYRHTYVHNGATVPTEMPFIAKSDFTVTKYEANDFQIKFGENKPNSYTMVWNSEDTNLDGKWNIYLSAAETAFKPKDFLEKLNAKSLKGKSLAGLSLNSLTSYQAKDYTHQSMQDYYNTPELYLKKALREYRTIQRYY